MNRRRLLGVSLAVAVLVGTCAAEDAVKSGPQPGDAIPGPFNVLNINGTRAGQSNCQI